MRGLILPRFGKYLDRHALSDGESTALCARLKERGIPYISDSGYLAVAALTRQRCTCALGHTDERAGGVAAKHA